MSKKSTLPIAEDLTAEELAEILNISVFTVLKLGRAGELPCKYVNNRPLYNFKRILAHFRKLEGGIE